MVDNDLYQKLLEASFRFVSYRPRSEKEIIGFLNKKLHRWKVSGKATVAKVLERLRELGYVDDRKFVQWWIEQRSRFKPKGERLLRTELMQKGIERSTIDGILHAQEPGSFSAGRDTGSTSQRELDNARHALHKKLTVWQKFPVLAKKRKIYDFLARRGFASDTIYRIIDEVVGNSYNTGT